MYSTASNGAVREWVLAHNIKNIKFSGAMWEHSGWINDVIPSNQTPGTCASKLRTLMDQNAAMNCYLPYF